MSARRIATAFVAGALALQPLAAAQPAPPPPSTTGYEPADELERGLWYQVDEAEREIKTSKFLVTDPALNSYVNLVLCRTVGEDRCKATRLYIVRTPQFNASMAPNGLTIVNTGLLLRMRDEAQLAAVLGHEFTHFENRHSVRLFRDIRKKTDALSWLSFIPIPYLGMASQIALIGSVYGFSRDMEREADAGSIEELVRGGYDPRAASAIWSQLGAEFDATAAERKHKSQKERGGGLFATHPRTTERMGTLAQLAEAKAGAEPGVTRADEFKAAIGPWWARLIDDQISLGDFGGTEYLLATLAGGEPSGWTADLLYARGELYRARAKEGDFAKAADFYRQAIAKGDAPVETWRGLGLALMRGGDREEGKAALRDYLSRNPDAYDYAMLRAMAGEGA
ncbi:TPR repeat-containing protein YfgC precursor [Tsuneonella dongtanensis]|uniref:TPR repeat-containing protein YfgC n=1 Tax=Tsuneonella dongtanensis TaxID=692370 RepID=A0A1B2ACS5_9SPHN|nr:M48 family metalloprotease [Tsuneonella dongtanensis]ANY19946.1 TPR repeat-containing protein YfgC precursor [Tsuneonella dongtanensis]